MVYVINRVVKYSDSRIYVDMITIIAKRRSLHSSCRSRSTCNSSAFHNNGSICLMASCHFPSDVSFVLIFDTY